jgi:hypothetical protein
VLKLIGGEAILMLGVAGLAMVVAGISVVFVKEFLIVSKV